MNTSQTVARLEALLARVRRRAAEPRPTGTAVILTDAPRAAVAPAPAPVAVAPPPPPPPPPMPPQRTEADIVLEVDVAEATQDTIVAVATDDVVAPAALDSRERLVAAEPLAAEAPAVDASPTDAEIRAAKPISVPQPEAAPAELSDDEIEEAPASSRRPVGPQPEERLAEMAFGAEEPSPPRHTPPPESGRLPAAPSEPEFDVDITGVRDAKPATRPPEPQPEPQRAAELAPVAVHGDIAASSAVADVVGHAERAAPSRFVELLDASLAL